MNNIYDNISSGLAKHYGNEAYSASETSAAIDKITRLREASEQKKNRLITDKDINDVALSNATFTTEDGHTESMKNKIINDMTADQKQKYLSDVANQQVYSDEQGQYQLVDGKRVAYNGNTQRLYMYGDKAGGVKLGLARGDLPSSDYRYQPGRAEREGYSVGKNGYGWDAGEKGVDLSKNYMDMVVPANVAKAFEGVMHGNKEALQGRTVKDANDPAMAKAYGSGKSEYYTSPEALLGRSTGKDATYDSMLRYAPDTKKVYNGKPAEPKGETGALKELSTLPGAFASGAVSGTMNLADFVAEIGQKGINAVADTNYKGGLFDDKTIEKAKTTVGRALGYNEEDDIATNARAQGHYDKAFKDIKLLSPSTYAKLLDSERMGDIGKGILEQIKNPSTVGTSLGELIGAGGVASGGSKAIGYGVKKVMTEASKETMQKAMEAKARIETIRAGKAVDDAGKAIVTKEAKDAAIAEAKKDVTKLATVADTLHKAAPAIGYAADITNQQLNEYRKNNNGEDPSGARLGGMFVANMLAVAVPEIAATKISLGMSGIVSDTIKEKVSSGVGKAVTQLGAAGIVEFPQELTEGIVESINTKWGTKAYEGKSITDIVNDDTAELLGQGIGGAIGGVHMAAPKAAGMASADVLGRVIGGVGTLADKAYGAVKREPTEPQPLMAEATIDSVLEKAGVTDKETVDAIKEMGLTASDAKIRESIKYFNEVSKPELATVFEDLLKAREAGRNTKGSADAGLYKTSLHALSDEALDSGSYDVNDAVRVYSKATSDTDKAKASEFLNDGYTRYKEEYLKANAGIEVDEDAETSLQKEYFTGIGLTKDEALAVAISRETRGFGSEAADRLKASVSSKTEPKGLDLDDTPEEIAAVTKKAVGNAKVVAPEKVKSKVKEKEPEETLRNERETSYDDLVTRGISERTIRKYAKAYKLGVNEVADAFDLAIKEFTIANMKSVSKGANDYQYTLWYDDKKGILPSYIRYKKALANEDMDKAQKEYDHIVQQGYELDVLRNHYEATVANIQEYADDLQDGYKARGKTIDTDGLIRAVNEAIAAKEISNEVGGKSGFKVDVKSVLTGEGKANRVLEAIKQNIAMLESMLGEDFMYSDGEIVSTDIEATEARAMLDRLRAEKVELEKELATVVPGSAAERSIKADLNVVNTSISNREEQLARLKTTGGKQYKSNGKKKANVDISSRAGTPVGGVTAEQAKKMKEEGTITPDVKVQEAVITESAMQKKLAALRDRQKLRAEAKNKAAVMKGKMAVKVAKAVDKLESIMAKFDKHFLGKETKFRDWADTYTVYIEKLTALKEKSRVEYRALEKARKLRSKLIATLNGMMDDSIAKINDDVTASELDGILAKAEANGILAGRMLTVANKQLDAAYEIEGLEKALKDRAAVIKSTREEANASKKNLKEDILAGNIYTKDKVSKDKIAEEVDAVAKRIELLVATVNRANKLKGKNTDYLARFDTKIAKIKEAIAKGKYVNMAVSNRNEFGIQYTSHPTDVLYGDNKDGSVPAIRAGGKLLGSVTMNALLNAADPKVAEKMKEAIDKNVVVIKAVVEEAKSGNTGFMLDNNPALGLLLSDDGKINTEIAKAMAVSIMEWIAISAGKLITNSNEEIARMRGLNSEIGLTPLEKSTLRHGKFLKNVTAELGEAIMKDLGITLDKSKLSPQYMEKFKSGLGHIGMLTLRKSGAIKDFTDIEGTGIKAEVMNNINNTKKGEASEMVADGSKGVALVKLNVSEDKVASMLKMYADRRELVKAFKDTFDIDTIVATYRTSRRKVKDKFGVRRSLKEAPARSEEILTKLVNEEYTLNLEALDAMLEGYSETKRQEILESTGWMDTKKMQGTFILDDIEAQEALNMELENELDSIVEAWQAVKDGKMDNSLFFDWFMAMNGRYLVDSTTINPQTQKHIARWLVMPKSVINKKWDLNNAEDKLFLYQGIAQATKFDIDKNTPKAVEEYVEGLIEGGLPKGASHIGHYWQATAMLDKIRKDRNNVVGPMLVEYDEVTSGFALKLMQMPLMEFEKVREWLLKTGVVVVRDTDKGVLTMDGKEVKYLNDKGEFLSTPEIRAQANFLDAYRTLAKAVTSELNIKEGSLVDKLTKAGVLFEIVDKDGKVTDEGRELFKYPFMMFQYGAGMKGLKGYIGHHIALDLLRKIAKGTFDGNKEAISAINAMFGGTPYADIKKQLTSGDLHLSDIVVKKEFVYNKLLDMFSAQYGSAFEGVMMNEFGNIVSANKTMTQAAQLMFKMFDNKYKEAIVEWINNRNGEDFSSYDDYSSKADKRKDIVLPTAKELEGILDSVAEYIPGLRAPNSKGVEDSIMLLDTAKASMKGSAVKKVQTNLSGGKDASTSVGLMIREYASTIAAGAVLPTHWEDGTTIGEALILGGVLGIHDAVVVGDKHTDVLTAVNKGIYDVGVGYNSVSEYLTSVLRMAADYTKGMDGMEKEAAMKSIAIEVYEGKEKRTVALSDIIASLMLLENKVNVARAELYGHDIVVGNMSAPKGSYVGKASDKLSGGIIAEIYSTIKDNC